MRKIERIFYWVVAANVLLTVPMIVSAQRIATKQTAKKKPLPKREQATLDKALFLAVDKGQINLVKTLLKRGASPNTVQMSIPGMPGEDHSKLKEEISDVGDPTYLRMKMTVLDRAISNDNLLMAKLLLEHGADVNARGWNNHTALIDLANGADKTWIDLLLKYKADVNAKSDEGFTPLNMALRWNKLELAERLRKLGAKEE